MNAIQYESYKANYIAFLCYLHTVDDLINIIHNFLCVQTFYAKSDSIYNCIESLLYLSPLLVKRLPLQILDYTIDLLI